MNDETPEIESAEEEPKPKRRRRKAASETARPSEATASTSEAASASAEVTPSSEATVPSTEGEQEAEGARVAAEPEPASSPAEPEAPVGPSADVEPEAEEEPEEAASPETAQAPARSRPRRGAEPAAQPTPSPRRRRRAEARRDVVVRAQAKYVRTSARKARLVCDHIRGKSVEEARAILTHAPRAVARDWSKVLESAVANAEHNHELIAEDLYIKAVHADEGPTIKRFRPRALGRATRIRKRTSHLTILLTPKP
jgi:ribosomal protein L22